jgi:hypothetical protein
VEEVESGTMSLETIKQNRDAYSLKLAPQKWLE